MEILWGIGLVVLSLVCWGGQLVVVFAPATALRLNLVESEEAVEKAFWADSRGEAIWDVGTLWTLLAAGILLAFGVDEWAYFGLAGGAMYVYFAGRGILARMTMQSHGLRIGTEQNVRTAYAALAVWGAAGLVTIIAAVTSLA